MSAEYALIVTNSIIDSLLEDNSSFYFKTSLFACSYTVNIINFFNLYLLSAAHILILT